MKDENVDQKIKSGRR